MFDQTHIHVNTHKNTPQNSMCTLVYIHKPLHSTETHNMNMNMVEGGMLDCTHDHASHIHPHPQQKAEPGWGPHLPGMAGRHDLVPREVLLPLPSAWALLWQETGIPVSEQAIRTQQAGGQESTLPISVTCGGPCIHMDALEWLSAFTLEDSDHVPTTILLLPSGVQRYLGNWKNQRQTWPSSEVSAIHQEARLSSTSHMPPHTRQPGWMPVVP